MRNQLKIDGAEIYDVTVVGAEHYLKWIAAELSGMKASGKKLVFGFDGRTLTTARMQKIADALRSDGLSDDVALRADMDLIAGVWADRPAPGYKPIFDHLLKYAGRGRREKIADVRKIMKEHGCDHYIVGTMEGTAWLTNMRGQDIINPLFMSHALFTPDAVKLFAKIPMIPEALQKDLIASGYELFDIDAAGAEIGKIPESATVLYDEFRTNCFLFSSIPAGAKKVNAFDIVNDLKAIKNDVEIENLRVTNKLEWRARRWFGYSNSCTSKLRVQTTASTTSTPCSKNSTGAAVSFCATETTRRCSATCRTGRSRTTIPDRRRRSRSNPRAS